MIPAPMQVEGVLAEVLLAAPSPSDGQEFTPVSVSPGLEGFFFTFILAALLVLLLIDMARRVRRVQAAARVKERYEGQERSDGDAGAGPDGAVGPDAAVGPDGAADPDADGSTRADGSDPSADGSHRPTDGR